MTPTKFAYRTLVALLCLLALPLGATSAELLSLRPEAIVSDEVVRFGDLVSGAGERSGLALFRAPELGKIGTIRAESINRAAKELGLDGINAQGLAAITISRPAREISVDAMRETVRSALIQLDASLSDATVIFDADPAPVLIPRDAVLGVETQRFDVERGRFAVRMTAGDTPVLLVSGVIESRLGVPVLVRGISRGDVISSSDYTIEQRSRRSLPVGIVTDPAKLQVMVAKRPLRAGQTLGPADVAGRDLVERNQKVVIRYEQPGMSLSLSGKALASGGSGAVVSVQNLASKRVFDAVVTGQGTVSAKVGP